MGGARRAARGFTVVGSVFAVLWVLVASFAHAGETEALRFGVVPQQSASELARLWTPFMDYLERRTGIALRFETARDIPTFESRLVAGRYDLAYVNPRSYTLAHASPARLLAFAKEEGVQLTGILVVHRDSPVRTLRDLHGQTVAFPAETAFAASVVPRESLARLGVQVTPRYVSSHESVYRVVAKGLNVAGGGVPRTLDMLPPDIRAQLRVLWTSPNFTPHAFAAHERVPRARIERLREAMTTMMDDAEGRAVLAGLNFKRLTGAQDSDYDPLRRTMAASSGER